MIRNAFTILLIFTALAAPSVFITGCAGKLNPNKPDENALVIPDFPTAKEQFQFARMYKDAQIIAPELKRRKLQMQKIGECFQRVITNFPNDPVWVPMTYLELGDCAAQADELNLATQYYQQAYAASQDEFVQARSQYSIARILDTNGKFEEAKAIYKTIIDRFGKTESGKVQDVVRRSAQLYVKVHEKR